VKIYQSIGVCCLALLLLAGCGAAPSPASPVPVPSGPPPEVPVAPDQPKPTYLSTVGVNPGESLKGLEARTGGKVLVWQEGESAIVGFDEAAAKRYAAVGGTLEANTRSFLAGGQIAWINGRSSVWAGGGGGSPTHR